MIGTQSYAEFSLALHSQIYAEQIPVNGTFELSNRCPLECVHCYNNLPMGDAAARKRELNTEEVCRVLDELADMGCLWLLLTGGEIFARHDFFDIYRHAKSRGFLLTLFTNGTLITERIADELARLPPFVIEITLYGRTKATYESLTGIPGSFEKCLRGIRLLLERGLPLKLKTVALTINRHEINAMKRFAEELGCEFKFDPMINPRIDCSSSPLAVRLTPEDIVALDLEEPKRVSEWRRLAMNFPVPDLPEDGSMPTLYNCGGGVNSFAIDPYGDLTICVLSHVDKYNVRDGSVREGWETFLRKVRQKKITRVTKCTTCQLASMCGSCAANGELEEGDPEAPVDFLCRVAHLRAEVFEVPIRPHGDCEYCGDERDVILTMAERARARHRGELAEVMAMPLTAEQQPKSGCGPSCGSCSVGR